MHDQQIVHRDVKPQNLILSENGVVLVDFGIARLLDEAEEQGTVGIGTPRFMAPEVFAGGNVSARTDVFSVAATLWTLLAGRPPVYADPTKLSSVNPDVTPELERTVIRRPRDDPRAPRRVGGRVRQGAGRAAAHRDRACRSRSRSTIQTLRAA